MEEVYKYIALYLARATPFILFACITLVIIRFNKVSANFRVLFYYLVLSLLANLGMKLIAYYWGNNLIVIPLFGFFELALFTVLYARHMDLKKVSNLVWVVGIIGCGYILYETCTVNTIVPSEFQSYSRPISAFIIVCYSMIYFFDKLLKGTDLNDSTIKLNATILVFFSLNIIFLLPMNFLIGENSNYVKFYFWIAYTLIVVLFYLTITFSIWKNGRTPKRLHSGSES
ncbi:MAG: hypothetical protein ACI8ZM_004234 [Crocinitomix sp.]|jgi:hypothetical protein